MFKVAGYCLGRSLSPDCLLQASHNSQRRKHFSALSWPARRRPSQPPSHLVQNDLFAFSYFFPGLPSHASVERAMSGLWPFLLPQNMSFFDETQPH